MFGSCLCAGSNAFQPDVADKIQDRLPLTSAYREKRLTYIGIVNDLLAEDTDNLLSCQVCQAIMSGMSNQRGCIALYASIVLELHVHLFMGPRYLQHTGTYLAACACII